MKVAVLGQGGREHALACSLLKSDLVNEVLVIPGNAGMELTSKIKCILLNPKLSKELIDVLKSESISLVIIGPEDLLAAGLADELENAGFIVVGPKRNLAQLESSKLYAKRFMSKYHIPTAAYKVAHSALEAKELLNTFHHSVVLKADELHAGKGVFVIDHLDQDKVKKETNLLIEDLFTNKNFSVNTSKIVMEEKLIGKEVSVFALSDGENFKILGYVCDHKRLLDDDLGPNTGGMGCYTVNSWPNFATRNFIKTNIVEASFNALKKEGECYRGFLFFGLMIDENNLSKPAQVIEYNVRMGDPETQTLLPQIKEDLVPYFLSLKNKSLNLLPDISYFTGQSIHVVLAAKGYPGIYGETIERGIPLNYSNIKDSTHLYFAGVKRESDILVSSGGRVLGLTVLGKDIFEARERVYEEIKKIAFSGAQYRHDIGSK